MKTSIFCAVTMVVLAMFMTGCCTSAVIENSHTYSADFFFPSAVYGTTNMDKCALEGVEIPHSDFGTQLHTYVIIPPRHSVAIYAMKGNSLALEGVIRGLPMTNFLQTNSLPPAFYKITNLQTNQNGLGREELRLKEYNSLNGAIVLYPFAVVTDVVTAPIQAVFFILMMSAMGHNC